MVDETTLQPLEEFEINSRTAVENISLRKKAIGVVLGVLDGVSWIMHGKGADLRPDDPEKKKYLDTFALLRAPIEALPYGISIFDGLRIGKFLANAAASHDEAEEDVARGFGLVENNQKWDEARDYLNLRYQYILLARDRKINLNTVDRLVSNKYMSLKEKISALAIGDPETAEKASRLANYETNLWMNHHDRNYEGFYDDAMDIFLELGWDVATANSAALTWIYSCKRHDSAEEMGRQLQGRSKSIIEKFVIAREWLRAGMGQARFYQILLSTR